MNAFCVCGFQLTVRACDNGIPQKCTNIIVTITINKGGRPPKFMELPYAPIINDTTIPGYQVLQLTAVDPDQVTHILNGKVRGRSH